LRFEDNFTRIKFLKTFFRTVSELAVVSDHGISFVV
jgi:hypothetical protein